jgi:DNA-binding transcriptional regulator YhcF (GntR family)
VAEDARGCIIKKRKNVFYENFVVTLLHEANNLGISREELITMINTGGNTHE